MPDPQPQLDPAELREWQQRIEAANLHNVLCHCRQCDREWIASSYESCVCGSTRVEHILCWQFPDD